MHRSTQRTVITRLILLLITRMLLLLTLLILMPHSKMLIEILLLLLVLIIISVKPSATPEKDLEEQIMFFQETMFFENPDPVQINPQMVQHKL